MVNTNRVCGWLSCLSLLAALSATGFTLITESGESRRILLAILATLETIKALTALTYAPIPKEGGKGLRTRKPVRFRPRDFFKCAIFLPSCVVICFCLIVLFGAPALSQHEETFTLACLLTILAALPPCIYVGVDLTISAFAGAKKLGGDEIADMMQRSVILTPLGAWCGSVVVPLDWDCPWQAWPIPCFLGALTGHGIAQIITLIRLIPFVSKRLLKKSKY